MATVLKMLDWRVGLGTETFAPKSRRKQAVPHGIIYFIGPRDGLVKIGFTGDLPIRLKRLQCGSPVPLYVIASVEGPMTLEREYHARFKRAREHGEWFLRTVDVEAEIDRLNQESRTAGSVASV